MYITHVSGSVPSNLNFCSSDFEQQHHMSDIYAGTVIGLTIGVIAFRSVYAAVFDHRYNHIPLPPFAAKTRFLYLKDGTTRPTDKSEELEEEADKLVVWNWWKSGLNEQNREKEVFWLRNIRTIQATGCESSFQSEPILPQNERDITTRERAAARHNIASAGVMPTPQ